MASWKHRRASLVHDASVSAWMLSPNPVVMKDVKEAMDQPEWDQCIRRLESLAIKLLMRDMGVKDREERQGKLLEQLNNELQQFHDHTGPWGGRPHIWESEHLVNGKSYLWHHVFSRGLIRLLGRRVTSWILGIGSAERSWGDVKHIRGIKRRSLSMAW